MPIILNSDESDLILAILGLIGLDPMSSTSDWIRSDPTADVGSIEFGSDVIDIKYDLIRSDIVGISDLIRHRHYQIDEV